MCLSFELLSGAGERAGLGLLSSPAKEWTLVGERRALIATFLVTYSGLLGNADIFDSPQVNRMSKQFTRQEMGNPVENGAKKAENKTARLKHLFQCLADLEAGTTFQRRLPVDVLVEGALLSGLKGSQEEDFVL